MARPVQEDLERVGVKKGENGKSFVRCCVRRSLVLIWSFVLIQLVMVSPTMQV